MKRPAAGPSTSADRSGTSFGFLANLNGYYDASLNLPRVVAERTSRCAAERDVLRALIRDPAALSVEQQRIREAVLAGIGGLACDEAIDGYRATATTRMGAFTIENILYESAPRVLVTANLYRPERREASGPAVFIACGHSDEAKAAVEYQRVARLLASSGFTVLIADPVGQGERHSYLREDGSSIVEWGTTEHTYAGVQSWWAGRSLARYLLRDAMAGITLLSSLPEVDAARIGVTGNSGGGMLTTLLMALDPRIAAAAPGTFVSGRAVYQHSGQRQDAEQILLGGTAAGVDHADLLLTMSPRPVLVNAAEYDFFPFEATVETVDRANEVLEACGRKPVELFSAPVPHRYDAAMADAALGFFSRALGQAVSEREALEDFLGPDELQVTQCGQVLLEVPGSETAFDSERRRSRTDRPDSDEVFLAWLASQVRGRRPAPAASFPRWWAPEEHGDYVTRQGYWFTEDQIICAGVAVRRSSPGASAGRRTGELHIVVDDGGTPALSAASPWMGLVAEGHELFVVDVRGAGALIVHDRERRLPFDIAGATYKLCCDLLWLGDSLQAGRTFDLLRTVELVRSGLIPDLEPTRIVVHGASTVGFTAVLATLLDPTIDELRLHDVVEPFREVSDRINRTAEGAWQCVLPGFTRHAGEDTVRRLLGARLAQAAASLGSATVGPVSGS